MTVKRETMKFLIPISIYGIKSETLSDRRLIPCYISPQELSVDESKIINETFTKGGFYIEYWGENLPVIRARGTSGSGGIEVIEILRAVYRNEQIQMERLLLERAREASDKSQEDINSASVGRGVLSALDSLFENGVSEIINGFDSTIEQITNIFDDSVEERTNPTTLIPSTGTFAVSVDLFMQGYKYRGYFTDFNVSESAEQPGLFDYSFTFKVLRRSGKRSNFMPWHRNPYDAGGNPREASIPIEGSRIDELSYATNPNTYGTIVVTDGLSSFESSQNNDNSQEPNDVGVNRFKKVKS